MVSDRRSAGLLVFRRTSDGCLEVLIGHMGGPYWARKERGAWSIPKGEHPADEDPLAAARREFTEELGLPVPAGPTLPLGSVRQSGGKIVTVWAVQGDVDAATVVGGTFVLEWPPRSGVQCEFPELDRVAWTSVDRARELLVRAQVAFLDRLLEIGRAEMSPDPVSTGDGPDGVQDPSWVLQRGARRPEESR
jgi:predicted NUDIX family NTP pyrophosphohydrolase